MKDLYQNIIINTEIGKTQLAVLIDPDKMAIEDISPFLNKINKTIATHIFVGGSEVDGQIDDLILEIKAHTNLPIVLFPGDVNQISHRADGILFLSLISGRNPDYLIGKQIEAVKKLKNSNLEIIPTGYILIENGKVTSVEKVSVTKPISVTELDLIKDTAKAGEYLGMKLIYLEAGSGAIKPVTNEIIAKVKKTLNIPLVVGGGIKSKKSFEEAVNAGADLVVIGTAFENDPLFFEHFLKPHFKVSSQ